MQSDVAHPNVAVVRVRHGVAWVSVAFGKALDDGSCEERHGLSGSCFGGPTGTNPGLRRSLIDSLSCCSGSDP